LTTTPAAARAAIQADFSSRHSTPIMLTSSSESGDGRAQYSCSAKPPSRPGLPVGNAQIEQHPAAEQRHAAGRVMQLVPVEAGDGGKHLALVEALATGGGPDRVGRLDDQQGLVTVDEIDRLQFAGEMGGQLFALELHARQP
jgi:hypothetical protein